MCLECSMCQKFVQSSSNHFDLDWIWRQWLILSLSFAFSRSLARSTARPPSLFYMHDNFAVVACRFHQTHFICMSSVQVRETLCSQWQKKFFVARLDVWTMHCHMMRIRMPTEYFIVSCCFRNCNCNFHRTNSKTACVIWFDILKNWCKTFH